MALSNLEDMSEAQELLFDRLSKCVESFSQEWDVTKMDIFAVLEYIKMDYFHCIDEEFDDEE